MFRITPREKAFFDRFVDTSDMICKAAKQLDDLVNDYTDVGGKVKAIKLVEHDCDRIVHDIINQLNKSFVTPIDREDIYEIAKELDNITDFIEATAQRFIMFNVKTIPDNAKKFTRLIVTGTQELKEVMIELKNMKVSKSLTDRIIEVNRIENEGDEMYRSCMTELFSDGTDTVDIIKWKVIYDFFENSLDACEDVANIVEGVVMKHA